MGGLISNRRGRCSIWRGKEWYCAWWGGGAKTGSLERGVVNGKRGGVGGQTLVQWKEGASAANLGGTNCRCFAWEGSSATATRAGEATREGGGEVGGDQNSVVLTM